MLWLGAHNQGIIILEQMNIKTFFSNWIVKNVLLAVAFVLVFALLANVLLSVMTRHGKEIAVPDFTNMTVQEAARVASSAGVKVVVSDSMYIRRMKPGTVYKQIPDAGEHVKEGRKIRLSINTLRPKQVPMPSLVGFSLRQAKAELQRNGLKLGRLIYVRDLATNNVISQQRFGREIAPGRNISSGTAVDLVLGLSITDERTFVPDLTGQQYQKAIDAVQENSLNVGRLLFDSSVKDYADSVSAFVYAQSPKARVSTFDPVAMKDTLVANSVRRGTEVTLHFTVDRNKLPEKK